MGITAVKQAVNGLAFFQPRQRAVLPEDRRRVGKGSFQTVVTAHEGAVAQIQTLVEDLPELLHIAAGRKGHIRQVDGHYALVETAVELVLAVLILPRTEGAPASHDPGNSCLL